MSIILSSLLAMTIFSSPYINDIAKEYEFESQIISLNALEVSLLAPKEWSVEKIEGANCSFEYKFYNDNKQTGGVILTDNTFNEANILSTKRITTRFGEAIVKSTIIPIGRSQSGLSGNSKDYKIYAVFYDKKDKFLFSLYVNSSKESLDKELNLVRIMCESASIVRKDLFFILNMNDPKDIINF